MLSRQAPLPAWWIPRRARKGFIASCRCGERGTRGIGRLDHFLTPHPGPLPVEGVEGRPLGRFRDILTLHDPRTTTSSRRARAVFELVEDAYRAPSPLTAPNGERAACPAEALAKAEGEG